MIPEIKEVPLVVTLKVDEHSQLFFDGKRKQYFPSHANYIDAHITLFHKLPSNKIEIENGLSEFAKHAKFDLLIYKLMLSETNVSYSIESTELQHLHAKMQIEFDPYLIRNDRKILNPHITIQNKVTAYKAYKTHAFLIKDFKPFIVNAIGFSSWYYVKGYWEKKAEYLFE